MLAISLPISEGSTGTPTALAISSSISFA
ncbi:hypothetical protein A2U01_0118339, partial [Trifolium medium]|nr:hypothetical protein [Trifolium medium]